MQGTAISQVFATYTFLYISISIHKKTISYQNLYIPLTPICIYRTKIKKRKEMSETEGMKAGLTKHEKIMLSTTEIAKRVRKQLKTEFPGCKFSVTTEYYSGGSSITLALMKSDRKVIEDFENITEWALGRVYDNYTPEKIREMQAEKSHQLNKFTLSEEYDPETWCNGTFLTEQGHTLMQRAVRITEHYNYDDSDAMTDYYSVNFHLSVDLGKWDRGFEDGTQ